MVDTASTFITELIGRTDEPMSFRVYIQPILLVIVGGFTFSALVLKL